MEERTDLDKRLLPYEIIERATQADPEAITLLLKHFESYIAKLSTRILYDEHGRSYRCLDPELQRRLEAKLIICVVQKFRIK